MDYYRTQTSKTYILEYCSGGSGVMLWLLCYMCALTRVVSEDQHGHHLKSKGDVYLKHCNVTS